MTDKEDKETELTNLQSRIQASKERIWELECEELSKLEERIEELTYKKTRGAELMIKITKERIEHLRNYISRDLDIKKRQIKWLIDLETNKPEEYAEFIEGLEGNAKMEELMILLEQMGDALRANENSAHVVASLFHDRINSSSYGLFRAINKYIKEKGD